MRPETRLAVSPEPGSGRRQSRSSGLLVRLLVSTALAGVIAGCAGAGGERAAAIVCSTAYRVAVTEPLTGVDTLRFEDADSTQSMPYIYLELHAQYSDGRVDGERALRLWVTRTAEPEPIVTHLYQLPLDEGPKDQFVGDHGFTGLHYAYDPVSGAELQYWCTAE
jgi:hypothetical protein